MHSPHGDGGTEQLRIEEIDPPRPGPGELLIDVAAAAVTPADIKFRSLGADFAGTVRAVGEGVHGSRVGEKVMGMVSVLRGGAYAEQMVVGAGEAAPVPDGLDLADAAALPMGVLTGDDLIERGLNVRAGERVMVTGAAGSVGRAAVYSAAERGAQVLAVVRSKPQPPISGASTTLVLQERGALVEAGPVDCVADTVGGDAAEAALGQFKPGGRLATVVVLDTNPARGKRNLGLERGGRTEHREPDAVRSRVAGGERDLAAGSSVSPRAGRRGTRAARGWKCRQQGGPHLTTEATLTTTCRSSSNVQHDGRVPRALVCRRHVFPPPLANR